ncbi:MAG TPA: hypothetical protein VF520_05435 [Thermoleophilaceae bacterium]|jgi:hypothetical protein
MRSGSLARYAPLAGVLFVVLLVVTIVVGGEGPDADDSTAKAVEFWSDNDSEQIAAAIVGAYAALALLWFAGALRGAIGRVEQEGGRLASLTFGGAVVLASAALVDSAIQFAAADTVGDVPPGVTQTLSVLYADFFFPFAIGLATFLLAAGVASLRFGVLPGWLGWAAILIGVVALTPIGFVAFLGALIWVLIASILLYRQGTAAPGAAPGAPPTATTAAG